VGAAAAVLDAADGTKKTLAAGGEKLLAVGEQGMQAIRTHVAAPAGELATAFATGGLATDLLTGSQASKDDISIHHTVTADSVLQRHSTMNRHHVRSTGVRMDIYTKWIKEELDKEGACLELPLTITLLISFSFMAMLHLQQDKVSIVENAITEDIAENANFAFAHAFGHKGIEDVNSYADFWSWTRLGLLPLLTGTWSYSEDLASAVPQLPGKPVYDTDSLPIHRLFPDHRRAVPVRNDYLRYNRIIGGIRLRQQIAVSSESKCSFPTNSEVFRRWFGKPCSPSETGELPPDLQEAEEFGEEARVEWILTETGNLSTALQTLIDMEDGCSSAATQNRQCLCKWCAEQDPPMPWLNEVTERVQISFVILNPSHGLYSQASVNFWFNRAGHIYKLIAVRSAWMTLFARPIGEIVMLALADGIWALLCFYVVWSEGREVFSVVGKSQKAWYYSITEDYMGFWNLIDWISIAVALTILLLGLILTFDIMLTNNALGEFASSSISTDPSESRLLAQLKSFFDTVGTMLDAESLFRQQLVLYPSVLMLRLFKSFAAQPRLAIVTETFVEARSDIFHFFIVFVSVYICMVVNAVLFFGQDSVDFATPDRAFHACFLVMFGDWDYDQMEQIGRLKASIWFWMFMIIVVLIMQNIMLAILMEAYSNVKQATTEAPTLLEQIKKQYRRWRQARRKERLRLNDIFDALLESEGGNDEQMLNNEKVIYPKDLLTHVEGLRQDQAERTMKDSREAYVKAHSDPFTTHAMSPNIHKMRSRFDHTLVCSALVAAKMVDYDAVERPNEAAGFEQPKNEDPRELNRGKTLEYSGAAHGAAPPTGTHRDDEVVQKKLKLQEGLDTVRKITQKSTVELSDAMEAVLAEEMQALERRQKEQAKSMEQMQASLQSLRSLAYKLSDTCNEVRHLSSELAPPVVNTAAEDSIVEADTVALWSSE